MASYSQRPRIVAQESPLATFMGQLPDAILSFMQLQSQLKFKAQEAEKDRRFKESQLYLGNLLSTRTMLQKKAIDVAKTGAAQGLAMDIAFDKVSPSIKTASGLSIKDEVIPQLLDNEIIGIEDEISRNLNEIKLAGLGAQQAINIDTNYSGKLDTEELKVFERNNPELLKELGLESFPSAYIAGAENYLLKPEVRKHQKNQAIISNTGKTLEALNKIESMQDNKYLLAANMAYQNNPISKEVEENITKAFTEQPDAVEALKGQLKATDTTFRSMFEGLESARLGVNKAFLRGLPIQGTEDYKANAVNDPRFVTSFTNDMAATFATWFSGKTRENKDYSSKPADWIIETFNDPKNGGWDDYKYAVDQVMQDPRWAEMLANPGKMKESFNWPGLGRSGEEDAATSFFLKSVEIYEMMDALEGKGLDYSPRMMEVLGATTEGTQVPADSTTTLGGGTSDTTGVPGANIVPAEGSQAIVPEEYGDQSQFLEQYGYGQQEEPRSALSKSMEYAFPGARGTVPLPEEDAGMALMKIFEDPTTPPSLARNVANALDLLQGESQVQQLANAITHSNVIKREFAMANQTIDIEAIIAAWKSEGEPDVSSWLLSQFHDIEPEFIR